MAPVNRKFVVADRLNCLPVLLLTGGQKYIYDVDLGTYRAALFMDTEKD